jgi:hypothetical protein
MSSQCDVIAPIHAIRNIRYYANGIVEHASVLKA